ncbi:MAG: lactonase family protein [Betaproteobacteria bacterium]|nr:lactonase family protein [Betaproteobacteria bacterium]
MFAYIGSFTTSRNAVKERDGHGKGISVYRIDQLTGAWTLIQVFDAIPNPGFLSLDRRHRFLYAAHGISAEISAYSIDKQTGRLEFRNSQPTGGNNSPHLTINPTNCYVVLANGPGVAVFPINKDGSLAPFSDMVVPPGEPGPYRFEQKGPHPHQVLFDITGRFIVAPDKGVDKVHVYRLDTSSGKLVANDRLSVKSRYGAGPRHVAFHPTKPLTYVINELDSTVTAYNWDSDRGELRPVQVIPTTPTTFTGDNTGAEIAVAPSGNFVYGSNRGHNSIVIFSVDQSTGMLDPICWEATQGEWPRFFALDPSGNLLYVANQYSDSIVVFRIDHKTGKLTSTGRIVETGTPSCIVFAHY